MLQKTLNRGQNHTPATLLTLAKLFIWVGDFRLACEVVWCCAFLAIQSNLWRFLCECVHTNFRVHHRSRTKHPTLFTQWKEKLCSGTVRRYWTTICCFRSVGLKLLFIFICMICFRCHSSFYTNSHNSRDVNAAFKDANEFIQVIHAFELTDEKKKELKKDNFNC